MKYWFTTILMMIITSVASFGQESRRMAVVETSTCYMRIAPDYESALETQELMGTVVEIVGESGYWREIVSPQPYKAWTTEKTLVEMSAEQIKDYEAAPKYIFTKLYGHIYSEPSEMAQTICDLVGGDVLRVSLRTAGSGRHKEAAPQKVAERTAVTKGKWVKVRLPSGTEGWVRKEQVRLLGDRINIKAEELRKDDTTEGQKKGDTAEEPQRKDTKEGPQRKDTEEGLKKSDTAEKQNKGDKVEDLISAQKMEAIIASAYQLLGVPYLWGGMSSKGVDCSGLVRISAIMNDVLLPRNASQQIFCGTPVEMNCSPVFWNEEYRTNYDGGYQTGFIEEMKERGKNLQRGDLVFFGTPATAEKPMRVTHVGIYLGNNRIIHSSHKVRINSLIPGDADYYENAHRLIAAVRL